MRRDAQIAAGPSASELERAQLLWSHPLLSRPLLETPPVKEFYAHIKFRLVAGGDSCCIAGHQRFGKSTAIAMTCRYLAAEFPDLPVYVFNCTNTSQTFSREFLAQWSAVVRGGTTGASYSMRANIEHALIERALLARSDRIVLILDEVQNIRLHELQFLKDIFNNLFCNGVRLVTISVGQEPDLGRRLTLLNERQDLVKRFFGVQRTFRGIRLDDEVQGIFSCVDDKRLDPLDVSWSEFFTPARWRRGWRLAKEAAAFAEALRKCGLIKRCTDTTEVSADVLFSALRCYLVRSADQEARGGRWNNLHVWIDAVREAGFGGASRSKVNQDGDDDEESMEIMP
ncbi:hypothetical protein A9Y76_07910 [Ralstonia insidiosa]|uniref:Uncharacterized protein n=1 Tax=Ralstonia insidiosa TaxID=190721 RepID=A0A191ZWB7_9RALS|nr:hypothetical protein A9Y76_07910 [Ralstonia insidiosa]KAB0472945.1 ATP-binding protein [Ralstonia insidiosa]